MAIKLRVRKGPNSPAGEDYGRVAESKLFRVIRNVDMQEISYENSRKRPGFCNLIIR
jgi:hypothetical protein